MTSEAYQAIADGLEDAIAYMQGDHGRGKVTPITDLDVAANTGTATPINHRYSRRPRAQRPVSLGRVR